MAVRKIIRMGHPTLRQRAKPLEEDEIGSDAVHRLVVDMIDTLHDYGGIGLAAPQVNEGVRLAIVELPGGPSRYGELPELPLTVFVNPEIEVLDPATEGYWEGCLSVPGVYAPVRRAERIRVAALDRSGTPYEREAEGLLAVCIQHEVDHLEGKVFVDYLSRLKRDRIRKRMLKQAAARLTKPKVIASFAHWRKDWETDSFNKANMSLADQLKAQAEIVLAQGWCLGAWVGMEPSCKSESLKGKQARK